MTTTQSLLTTGKRIAIISFLVGTFIFLLYFLTSSFGLLFVGYGFIAIVGLINIGVLVPLLLRAYKVKENRRKILLTCGLMLLNIPTMLIYCWFAILLLNTMRVTFINTTKTTLTNIDIIGCEPKQIDKLEPNESKTVWIAITGDCSLGIEYLSNGQKKSESVVGYCTNDMGQKMVYKIGSDNKP
jgi:hypothetical protein